MFWRAITPRLAHPPPTGDAGTIGAGSGFVVSEDGLLVTNDHVMQGLRASGAREIHAVFDDGRVYRVELLATDSEADLAVCRLVTSDDDGGGGAAFKPLRIGSSARCRRGDTLVVLGAPLGGSLVPHVGVLSGMRYVADDEMMNTVLNSRSDWCLLQVDAEMSSGNSGGPIVNAHGEVVGIAVMVQLAAGGVGHISYAIAIDQAWPIIQQLVSHGTAPRGAVGMTVTRVDRMKHERERAMVGRGLLPPGGRYITGLLVDAVQPGRPADAAGLQPGDVLLEINGRRLITVGDYFAALGPVYTPGKELRVVAYRPRLVAEEHTARGRDRHRWFGGGGATPTAGGRGGQPLEEGHIFTTVVKPQQRAAIFAARG